jgi:hypothetical protein
MGEACFLRQSAEQQRCPALTQQWRGVRFNNYFDYQYIRRKTDAIPDGFIQHKQLVKVHEQWRISG